MTKSIAMTRILVVGSGAVGTMVSYALEAGGKAEVTSVLRSNFDIVNKKGFTIDSLDHGRDIQGWRPSSIRNTVPDVPKEELQPFSFIVVTTKNIADVPPLLADVLEPAVTPESVIVLIQNGLNIEKPVIARFPNNVVLSGVQLIGANETSPGVILQNEPDDSKVGPFRNTNVTARDASIATQKFVDLYMACGKVTCVPDNNVEYTRWRKLLYNSSYNTVAAVLKMDVTRMRAYEHIIDNLVKPIMKEIQAIALAAAEVRLTDADINYFITVDSPDSWFMPSMGQDALKGNLMEFENIVGEPLREAIRVGVPAPTLRSMYGVLKALQTKAMEAKGLIRPDFVPSSKYHNNSS